MPPCRASAAAKKFRSGSKIDLENLGYAFAIDRGVAAAFPS
jgi:hypothetical protein